MTDQKDLKKLVRARMAKTGESYTAARSQLLGEAPPDSLPRARGLVQVAIEREPRVTAFGLGVYDQSKKTADAIDKEFKQDRAYLLSDAGLDEVEACARWLDLQLRTKTFNRQHTSYGYKHNVERWSGRVLKNDRHICNGALIAAALGMGFDFKPDHGGSPNVWLNLSERRLKVVEAQRAS